MKKIILPIILLGHVLLLLGCESTAFKSSNNQTGSFNKNETTNQDHKSEVYLNAFIEIPAGTNQKWEVDKVSSELYSQEENGEPRIISYLAYPGNYGFIPFTLLDKENGGDGDPLDVIVLGPAVNCGDTVRVKLLGVLKLLDNNEHDDKLIAVGENSKLKHVLELAELDSLYPGITDILKIWFTNYKGNGKMKFQGFGNLDEAKGVYLKSRVVES